MRIAAVVSLPAKPQLSIAQHVGVQASTAPDLVVSDRELGGRIVVCHLRSVEREAFLRRVGHAPGGDAVDEVALLVGYGRVFAVAEGGEDLRSAVAVKVSEEDFGVGVAGLVVTRGQRAPVVQREVALKGVALAVVEQEGQDAGLQARGGFDSRSVQVRCGRLAPFAPLQQEQGRLRLRRDDEGVGLVWISQVAVELRFRFLLR